MKLYDSIGPNPHIVRMFMAEKGIDIPKQTVDLRLKYDTEGRLTDLEVVRNSGNLLYDQHVFDQAAALHRTVRLSIPIAAIDVQVTRAQAAVDERKQRRSAASPARVAVGDRARKTPAAGR